MKGYEKSSTQSVYILWRNREDCATASEHIFWRLLLKENVQLIFFYIEDCVTASGNISMFFKERAAASEKILRKNVRLLLKENVQLLLRIMST